MFTRTPLTNLSFGFMPGNTSLVGITPDLTRNLVCEGGRNGNGCDVFMHAGASIIGGFPAVEFAQAGAIFLSDPAEVIRRSDVLIGNVSINRSTLDLLRPGHILLANFHPDPKSPDLDLQKNLDLILQNMNVMAFVLNMLRGNDETFPVREAMGPYATLDDASNDAAHQKATIALAGALAPFLDKITTRGIAALEDRSFEGASIQWHMNDLT